MDLTWAINWFGTSAGILGVVIAMYLQLINPRQCDPRSVAVLFLPGSALIMLFASAWADSHDFIQTLKIVAIALFVTLELIGGYHVYQRSEAASVRESIASFFPKDRGGSGG